MESEPGKIRKSSKKAVQITEEDTSHKTEAQIKREGLFANQGQEGNHGAHAGRRAHDKKGQGRTFIHPLFHEGEDKRNGRPATDVNGDPQGGPSENGESVLGSQQPPDQAMG